MRATSLPFSRRTSRGNGRPGAGCRPCAPAGAAGRREDVETVVEVFPEARPWSWLLQIPVGGGDGAHVGFHGSRCRPTLELPLLDNAEELDLDGWDQIADLVQEEGAAVGQFEAARLAGARHR